MDFVMEKSAVYLNTDNQSNHENAPKSPQKIEDQINQITKDCEVSEGDSKRVCRLCAQLIKEDKVVHIFNTLDIVQKINYALPVTVSLGDGLPNFICGICEDKLNTFHNFVCEVVKADKQLRAKLTSPSDNVTKTIEEIFGTDSDDDIQELKPKEKPAVKHRISNDEETTKKPKTEPPLPDSTLPYKYTCNRCGEPFYEFSTLLDHYKIQHGGKELPCPEVDCSVTAKSEKSLREHIKDSHSVPVICYKCGKIFLNQQVLLKHQRNKHSAKVCGFCWLTFETDAGYLAHMNEHKHSNQQQCVYCYKTYQTSQGLKRHTLRCHSKEITLLMGNISSDEV